MAVVVDATGEEFTATNGLPGNTYTFTGWVRPNAVGVAHQTMYWLWASGDVFTGIQFRDQGDLQAIDGGSHSFLGVGPLAASANTWYRVALVVSGANATFYRSAAGSALGSGSVTDFSPPASPSTWYIGDNPYDEHLNGRMAAIKVWSVALTQAEVESELAQYAPKRTTNLLRFHPFIKTETVDYSGQGNALSGGTGTTTDDGPPIPWRIGTLELGQPSGAAAVTATPGSADATGTANAPSVAAASLPAAGSASGAAQSPVIAENPQPSAPGAAGAANTAGVAIVVSAGVATATGSAAAPTSSTATEPATATGSALGQPPSAAIAPTASSSAGTGAALGPTVLTDATVTALAGVATGSGVAGSPTAAIASTSGAATATALVDTAPVQVASAPTTAAATGTGHSATIAVIGTAGAALASGLAMAPSIAGTASRTFTAASRVRSVWHADDAAPTWTTERIRLNWQTEQLMITRSALSHETVLFGPIRYLVDGVAASPTALTVHVAMTAATAGSDPSTWVAATWSTIVESGVNTYWAKIAVGPGSTLGAQAVGVRKAWVKITAAGETPILQAGYIEFI